jgi:hypothetical protein
MGSRDDCVNKPTLTPDQVRDALRGLSTAELYRIADYGRRYGLANRQAALDVLSHVIRKTLTGERACPVDVPIRIFLQNALRSLVWAGRKKAGLDEVSLDAMVDAGGFDPVSPDRDAEQLLIAKEEVQSMSDELERLFAGDEDAQLVLMGDFDQMPAEEIRSLGGWSVEEYATIRRRMRRAINKVNPLGLRP